MELIANAPWREAVTYRDTWPHEYVVVNKRLHVEVVLDRLREGKRSSRSLGGIMEEISRSAQEHGLDPGDSAVDSR